MTILTWVSLAGSGFSIMLALIAIFNFSQTRKAAAMEEGKRQEKFEQIMRDLRAAWDEIRILKGCTTETDKVLVEIKTTLKYIKESIDEIKENWTRHMEDRDA